MTKLVAKFNLGHTYITPGAESEVGYVEAWMALSRHAACDWGECCREDAQRNDEALLDGSRIFSVYQSAEGKKFWIITEAVGGDGKRAGTTVLLPSEY